MGSGYPGSCETSDKFCVVGGGISRLELIRRIANYVCRFTRRLVRIVSRLSNWTSNGPIIRWTV